MKKLLILLILFSGIGFSVFAERLEPKEVAPVVHNGVRYSAQHFGVLENNDRNGGLVEAFDLKTKKRLWLLSVYKIEYKKNLEKDVQYIFITRIEIKGNKLIVFNEKDDKFTIDLATQNIEPKDKVYK